MAKTALDPTIMSMHTVLIVDDNARFRREVRALLESEGFVVVGEAGDGVSGLEAARALTPQVVLLDIGLPDMDGFTVARDLSEAPVRVILTSSREAGTYGRRIETSAALGFIAKDELTGDRIRIVAGLR